jgi:hypothetical protein
VVVPRGVGVSNSLPPLHIYKYLKIGFRRGGLAHSSRRRRKRRGE